MAEAPIPTDYLGRSLGSFSFGSPDGASKEPATLVETATKVLAVIIVAGLVAGGVFQDQIQASFGLAAR